MAHLYGYNFPCFEGEHLTISLMRSKEMSAFQLANSNKTIGATILFSLLSLKQKTAGTASFHSREDRRSKWQHQEKISGCMWQCQNEMHEKHRQYIQYIVQLTNKRTYPSRLSKQR